MVAAALAYAGRVRCQSTLSTAFSNQAVTLGHCSSAIHRLVAGFLAAGVENCATFDVDVYLHALGRVIVRRLIRLSV